MRSLHRAAIVLGLIVILLTVGTVGFHLIERWSWFASFYTTLMTVSTIGADPENQLSHAGRVFNVVLVFLGLGVVGFAIGTFTHAVIEFELGEFFGRRRMERNISNLKDHFIICGVGRVGRRLAVEVAGRGLPLVIIEKDSVRAQWAREREFPVILGDASAEAILRQARIESARGLASAVTSDAQNVYIVLTARGLAPNLPIVARASEEDAESKLLRAGATTVISPYSYAGQRMARVLTRPNVQRFIDVAMSSLSDGNLDLQIEEVQVANDCKIAGTRLGETDIRKRLGIIILAIRRSNGRLDFNPGPDDTISAGDFLIAMGDSQKLKELEALAGVR
ncbi:MAG TPA: potassium channel protein [Candidatus Acidoferrales bacterium]|nr:potassium channel protein [Candidatus Acidoferrales bacterium]